MDMFVHCSVDNFQALEAALKQHAALPRSAATDLTKLVDSQHNTLMHACAQQGSLQCIQVIAKYVPALVTQRHAIAHTEPLHMAVSAGNVTTAHCLLTGGANPNSTWPDPALSVVGEAPVLTTPLATAIVKTNGPLLNLLLKAGAKVDPMALMLAIRGNQVSAVALLLDLSLIHI